MGYLKGSIWVALASLLLFLAVSFGQITKSSRSQPSSLKLNNVHVCCSVDASSEKYAPYLVECVNRSATTTSWPVNVKKRIALVTYATPDFYKFSAYTWAVNQAYAEHNGYVLRLADPSINYEPADARWNKVKVVEDALLGWAEDSDFVVWMDADLIFMDIGMKIEEVVADYPEAHLWFSTEHFGSTNLANTGLMIFRNSDFSKWLLREWWGFANRVYVNDQDQFDLFYAHYKEKMQLDKRVIVMPPDALNSEPPASVFQRDYNQILHMISENTLFRIKTFSTAWLEVCRVVKQQSRELSASETVPIDVSGDSTANAIAVPLGPPLRPQLGVDQEHLLAWALLEYHREYTKRMEHYEKVLRQLEQEEDEPVDGVYFHGSEISGKMNDQTVRYAELLEHIDKTWTDAEKKAFAEGRWTKLDEVFYQDDLAFNASTLSRRGINEGFELDPARKKSVFGKHKESGHDLRLRSFRLLMRNYKVMKRAVRNKLAKIVPYDLSMMMFDLINCGKSAIKIIKSLVERTMISDELIKIANELLDVIPEERRMNVRERIAELHVGRGLISKDENDNEEALEHFLTALEIKESVAEQVGDQFLPEILIIVADTLCQLGRFRESWPVFERTLEISERRLGPTSERFAMYSYMAGQAHMAGKDNTGAIPLLRNAIKAFEMQLQSPPDLLRARSLLKQAIEKSKSEKNAFATASTPTADTSSGRRSSSISSSSRTSTENKGSSSSRPNGKTDGETTPRPTESRNVKQSRRNIPEAETTSEADDRRTKRAATAAATAATADGSRGEKPEAMPVGETRAKEKAEKTSVKKDSTGKKRKKKKMGKKEKLLSILEDF